MHPLFAKLFKRIPEDRPAPAHPEPQPPPAPPARPKPASVPLPADKQVALARACATAHLVSQAYSWTKAQHWRQEKGKLPKWLQAADQYLMRTTSAPLVLPENARPFEIWKAVLDTPHTGLRGWLPSLALIQWQVQDLFVPDETASWHRLAQNPKWQRDYLHRLTSLSLHLWLSRQQAGGPLYPLSVAHCDMLLFPLGLPPYAQLFPRASLIGGEQAGSGSDLPAINGLQWQLVRQLLAAAEHFPETLKNALCWDCVQQLPIYRAHMAQKQHLSVSAGTSPPMLPLRPSTKWE